MAFEQFALTIGVGLTMGTLIAVMAYLSSNSGWNNKLFSYTLVIGVFSTFVIVQGVEGGVDESNIIKVILLVAGGSFFANKGIKMAERVRSSTTKKRTR